MLSVRHAEIKDVDKIMDLLGQVLKVHHDIRPDLFKEVGCKYTRESLISMLSEEKKPIFVCVDKDDKVVGHAFCEIKEVTGHQIFYDNKFLYIDDICVDKENRRMNVGKMLYEYCTEFAKSNNFSSIRLNVWNDNENALKFYEKMGMVPLSSQMEQKL